MIRDVLAGDVPGILYRSGDFYASAAAAAAAVVFLSGPLDDDLGLIFGVVAAIGVRVGSRLVDLNLPMPRVSPVGSDDALD